MLAVVCNRYGSPDVMQLREMPMPVPKPGQVLVRVFAATVTAGDCSIRRMDFPLLFRIPLRFVLGVNVPRPGILGQEFAGTIEQVGNGSRFKVGESVFGPTTIRMGAYAQYISVPEDNLTSFDPDKLSYEHAATIPTGAINGLHFVNLAEVKPKDMVLLNGAGGSIGTYALQMAKARGAVVTCVDSAGKLPKLNEMGADHVIDYRTESFVARVEQYDAIIDIIGGSPFSRCIKTLKPGGRYVLGNPRVSDIIRCGISNLASNKKSYYALADYRRSYLDELKHSMESKYLQTVIDKVYPIEQLADAHRYVETGKKIGNVIITMPT